MKRRKKPADLKTVDRLYGLFVISGMVLVLIGCFLADNLTLMYIGCALSSIGVFIVAPMAKCPHCGAFLRMKFGLPSKCPRCGKPLP